MFEMRVLRIFKYVFFDLDGTLIDPAIGITDSVIYSLEKFGIKVQDRSCLYKFIGPPLKGSYRKYYGFSEADADTAVKYYREYFCHQGILDNTVYEGIPRLLKALCTAGSKLVVATSKPEEFAVKILKTLGLYDYFYLICGATFDETRSKKTDIINYALQKLGRPDTEDAIMVGDREYDITGAAQNGMKAIGVLYGYGSREELEAAGAAFIVEKAFDILRLV